MAAASYGVVSYAAGSWTIEGEPFVRARLKRVFPRAPQGAAVKLMLSASPENSRELLWFLGRYPMVISDIDAKVMRTLAVQHVEAEQRLAELLAGIVPPADISMAEPARDYQIFAAQMTVLRGGLLLADDLGLGKTVSAIASILMASAFPAVIVTPKHLKRQWRDAFKRFAPGLETHMIKKGSLYDLKPRKRRKSQAEQLALLPESVLPDVIIISYHMLRGWAEFLAPLAKFAVYEECQALRRPGTGIHDAAVVLAGGVSFRLGLSATPIYNYGDEFFHVINVLSPDALGSHAEFKQEWCSDDRIKDTKEFGSYLRREGIMLRRTRKEVGRELPKLSRVVHEIDADEAVLDDLKGNAIMLARTVLAHNEQFRGEKMQAAGEFDTLMRQATGVAKAPYVVEFMKVLLDSGEKVVLFGWHRAVYSVWLEGLAEFKPVLYTGSESENQKAENLKRFIEGDSQVLIMSLRSGAGTDGLQYASSTVVIGELDWSPGVIEQCLGRVDRDGQDEPCTAYFLVSESGADPIMSEVLGVKREQIEGVRNPDMALIERIDTGENSLRRLAREFLARRGETLPLDEEVEAAE